MDSQWTASEIMKLVLKCKFLVAGITLALLFAAVTITFFLPRKYESFTRVRVVDKQALSDLYGLQLEVEDESPERARLIMEELRSQEAVADVIAHLELDRHLEGLPETEREMGREPLIREIQSSISVGVLEAEGGQFIFRVGIRSRDPARAQRIAARLTTNYLHLHAVERPESVTSEVPDAAKRTVETRREFLAAVEQLAKYEAEHGDLESGQKEIIDADHQREREGLNTVEDEISALLRGLKAIHAQLAEEPEWLTVAEAIAAGVAPGQGEDPNGRVPNQTCAELKKSELKATAELEISKQKRAGLLVRLEHTERRRDALPLIMKQRTELRERRDGLLRDLRKSEEQEEAAQSDRVTRRADGALIFEVLDPPSYPAEPDLPNQLVIAFMGLVLGLGAGTGTVLLLDLFDHSFRGPRDIREILDLPVLGTIPRIETPAQRLKAKRKARAAAVAITALFFLTATALFVQVSCDGDVGSLMARVLKMLE